MNIKTEKLTIEIGNKQVCEALNLQLNAGEVWAVLGANGVGKTTFLNTFMGLHAPSFGHVLLNNISLQRYNAKTIANHIGILLQNHEYTFADTVFDTIYGGSYASDLPKSVVTKRIYEIAQRLELNNLLSKPVTKLSGGEKRRVDFATLLLQAPQLYLLDEPTNHLDIKYQQQILGASQALAQQGNIIMLSTHDINIAYRYCHKIILFFGNGVTAVGDTESVLHEANLQALYQHRLKKIVAENDVYWAAEH